MSSTRRRFSHAWLSLMGATVTVYTNDGRDRYGRRTMSEGESYKARIEVKDHKTVNTQGETVFARGKVFLPEITGITPEDDLQLPTGERPRIISVVTEYDEHGPLYEVVTYA